MRQIIQLPFNDRFDTPKNLIPFDGSSLGRVVTGAPQTVSNMIDSQWQECLTKGSNVGSCLEVPIRARDCISAIPVAPECNITLGDTQSIKAHHAPTASLQMCPGRTVFPWETGNYPSCQRKADGVIDLPYAEIKQRQMPPKHAEKAMINCAGRDVDIMAYVDRQFSIGQTREALQTQGDLK